MAKNPTPILPKDAPTEIRHRYKPERPRKAWLAYERDLLNLTRKLRNGERIAVVIFAEKLVMNRIAALRRRRRRGA